MSRRFQFSLRGAFLAATLLCIGLAFAWYIFGVRDKLVQIAAALALGGLCVGGLIGAFLGRPIRWAIIGLFVVPSIGTAVVLAFAYYVLEHTH